MVLFSTRRKDPKVSPGGARGKSPLAAANSVQRAARLPSRLRRLKTRLLLGDVQDQRHVVAMRQPVFGISYSKIGRDAVAQECEVNVMPEAEVPGVKVRFRRLRPLVVHRVAVVDAAEPKPRKLFDQHAVVPARMRPVPDCVAVEVPHEQGVAAGKESGVAVDYLMGDANIP